MSDSAPPRVTIGIPVYNGAATFTRALMAIESQSFREFTVVISDNGSSDETPAIIAAFMEGKSNVRLIRQPKTIDAFENFRSVVADADTEFFVWLSDDDWWEPDYLSACVGALDANPAAKQSFTHFRVFYHHLDRFSGVIRHVPSVSYDNTLNAIIRSADMAPCAIYGLFRTYVIKDALKSVPGSFDFFDVFISLVVSTSGMLDIVDQDLFRAGVRSEAAIQRRSLDSGKIRYAPFLRNTTRLIFSKFGLTRGALTALNFWWRLWVVYSHNRKVAGQPTGALDPAGLVTSEQISVEREGRLVR